MNEVQQGTKAQPSPCPVDSLDLALAELSRTEDTITDHQDIVFVWISIFFSFLIFSIVPLLFANSELAAADTRFPLKPPAKPFKCEVV